MREAKRDGLQLTTRSLYFDCVKWLGEVDDVVRGMMNI